MTDTIRKTIRLPVDLISQIEKSAQKEGIDFSEAARRLLKAGVRSKNKTTEIGEFRWKKKNLDQ